MTERYWAIRIGRNPPRGNPYFALDVLLKMPALFQSAAHARGARKAILATCGHKDVYVVKVELRQTK